MRGQHEVAQAAQAGQRFAPAALGAGEPRDLGQPARDERRHRVVPEPQAFDDARGDGDDVLQRAANLDAGHVVADVEPERGTAEAFLDVCRRRRVARRRRAPPSADPRATSAAKLGPESTTTGWPAVASSREHDATCARANRSRALSPR